MSKDGIDNMSGSRPSSRMWEPELIILVDSREQLPYSFSCPSVVGTVPTGDYSVPGCEHLVAVERKSLPDLCQSITRERVRFEKELARSRQIPTFHLIVEGGLADILRGDFKHSRVSPESVFQSLIAFSVRYALPVWFVQDRGIGAKVVESILGKWLREHTKTLDGIRKAQKQFAKVG